MSCCAVISHQIRAHLVLLVVFAMRLWCFTIAACACTGAVPLANQKIFGHSIKNGALPARTEVTTFEHACSVPPCVVTQLHVPSIYPGRGDAWNWTQGVLSFYVDGETEPSIRLTLLELAGEAHFNLPGTNAQSGDSMPDGSPWGIALMGRTAKSGAVYSTMRIPFGKSLRVTIRACDTARQQSTYWFILRGLEGHAVVLGDLELPAAARLVVRRLPPAPVQQLQLVTLAQSPRGTAGALLRVQFDARGPSFGYLEGCMRFYADGATESTPGAPLFLSSGAEDYFLSASYFDEGLFKTPNSGLTFFNRSSAAVGAYKIHDRDPVIWSSGMKLVFRVCESTAGCGDATHCPNQFCNATQRALAGASATLTEPVLAEYFLGDQGASCDAACSAQGLVCNDSMDLGDADHGATMMAHLNISNCLKNSTNGGRVEPLTWWAPDQPGYISGEYNHGVPEPNYRQCIGFIGYPRTYSCSASFPTNSRVCHCTKTAPPTPAPAPPAGVEYGTLVLSYEWPTPAKAEPSQAASGADRSPPVVGASIGTSAALRLLQRLAQRGLIDEADQDDATDLVMHGDAPLVRLLGAFVDVDLDEDQGAVAQFVARHLRRYLATRMTAAK